MAETTPATPGVVWHWSAAVRGALYALPAGLAALHDPGRGIALAIGVLPAAAIGLLPTRRARPVVLLAGLSVALPMVLGSLLVQVRWVAVVGVFVLAVAAAQLAARRRFGALVLTLCLPMVGVGFSYTDIASALGFTLLILLGSVYACLLSLLWPEHPAPPRPEADHRPLAPAQAPDYGLRLGAAGATAAACGLALAPTHPGWPVAAALLVMRPTVEMQRLRSVGRLLSVLVGGVAALLLLRSAPPHWAYGCAAVAAITVGAATQGSRWYVLPAVPTFLVLLLLLHTDPAQAHGRFDERVGATLVGVALAYLFGLLLPRLLHRARA